LSTQKITTFFMFAGEVDGKAEEAMKFYTSLFKNSKIVMAVKYGPGEREGRIVHSEFTLDGQLFMAMDGGREHKSKFSQSTSLYVTCDSEKEIVTLWEKLVDSGKIMMELKSYDFAQKYGWLADRYGISWQLILPKR